MLKAKNYQLEARAGFTIVELLVAIALFSIAVSVAAGGFVRALRTQRQLVSLITANSNASLAIEEIARELRTGYGFECAGVGATCEELAFNGATGEAIAYRKNGTALERQAGGSWQPLTASNVDVRSLSFIIVATPGFPERVTIAMGVGSKTIGLETVSTNIQTTISSRAL